MDPLRLTSDVMRSAAVLQTEAEVTPVHHVDAASSTAATWLASGRQPAALQQQMAPAADEPRDTADKQRILQSSRATERIIGTLICDKRAAAVLAMRGSVSLAVLDGLPAQTSTEPLDSLPLAGSSATCALERDNDPSASFVPDLTPTPEQPTTVDLTALPAAEVDPKSRREPALAPEWSPHPSDPAGDGPKDPTSGLAPTPAQPACTQAATPCLRDSQVPDDSDGSRAAQLVRQSSMIVHPSTTRDVWPEAGAEPELQLDDLDRLDDWTPMRDHRAAVPRSAGGLRSPVPLHRGLPGSQNLCPSLAAASAMHNRAAAGRLQKEAR